MVAEQRPDDRETVEIEDAGALVAAADVLSFCTDAHSLPCPPPPELAAFGVPDDPPRWLRGRLAASEVARCLNAAREAERDGLGNVDVTEVDGSELRITVVNLLTSHGVFLWVVNNRSALDGGVRAGGLAKRVRHFACHRDELATFVWVEDEVEEILGWKPADLVGRTALDFIHPDDAARAVDVWVDVLNNAPILHSRSRWRTPSGEWRWVEVTNDNGLDEHGRIESQIIDIHQEMEAAAHARIGLQGFTTLTEALPIGVVQLDADGAIVYVNSALRTLTGADGDDTTAALEAVHSLDRDGLRSTIRRALEGDSGAMVARIQRYDGVQRTMEVQARPLEVDDARAGAIATFEDITERNELQDDLRRLAETDPLTGLANRRRVLEGLEDALAAAAEGGPLALLFIDLNDFKLLNDVSGHNTGDRYLVEFAGQLASTVGSRGLVGRVGGDEFVAVCPGTTRENAVRLAERVLRSAPLMRDSDPRPGGPGCSIGIATNEGSPDLTADQMLAAADEAMYSAKAARGSGWAVHESKTSSAQSGTG